MAPAHRRGPWVPEEDQLLLQLVREQGPNNWVRISQHMHYRSPKQCRERFHQNLKPSLNREPISAEEGLMIERMVNEMGKRWAEIARRLGNRSDNAVKNWWNGSMNRKRRGLPTSPHHSTSRTYNGRIEAPYTRASMGLSSPTSQSRFSPISHSRPFSSWKSPSRRGSCSTASVDCPPQLTPIYTLPALNRPIETPLTSPAFSESSNTLSIEPPSMISDHNSVSSASPRTVSSPQLLPLPVDPRQHYGEFRKHTDDLYYSGYQLPKPLEPCSEFSLKQRWIADHQAWNRPSSPLSQPWHAHPEPARPESSRDSRMGLDALLN
ncbi:putative MYB family conidiophore development protein FlbD [Aspergillus candidus]|uniref:Putative MYB family conidiophore development protein FlbD n=1 Tax=Aspergillus candidus TaxID=41067 RepID=A0A2I2FLD1_ASPCN|nr:putative MYB family conidiophore development protein FlbD [Aspergillus candidus]PLB41445.1 putative MYB family conidiophore development protein FlbD [Aspergillus candidus]